MAEAQSKSRIFALDYARAFCLLLVIIFHILLGLSDSGIKVPDWLMTFNNAMRTVRMPVFFFASGVLYALIFETGRAKFWKSLLIGLVIPFLVWSEIHGAGKVLFSSGTTNPLSPEELAYILWKPFDHFWFIYSLIFIRIIVKISSHSKFLLPLVFTMSLVYFILYRLGYFEHSILANVAKGTIYFIVGLVFARRYDISVFKTSKQSHVFIITVAGVFLFVIARTLEWQVFNTSAPLIARFLEIVVQPAIGVITIMVIAMSLPAPVGPLGRSAATVAQGSLVIYMLHPMIAAITRTLLVKGGISNWFVLFVVCMTVATVVPATIYLVASRMRLLPWLALGPNRAIRKPDVTARGLVGN